MLLTHFPLPSKRFRDKTMPDECYDQAYSSAVLWRPVLRESNEVSLSVEQSETEFLVQAYCAVRTLTHRLHSFLQ